MELSHDAIVLAGGTGRRMAGAVKPEVLLWGRRLLDHALDAVDTARRVVVVAPDSVAVPPGVARTLEDPPHGGPVAGIAAGLAALDAAGPDRSGEAGDPAVDPGAAAPLVLVLSCDVPGATGAVPRLLGALTDTTADRSPDGAVLRDRDGSDHWLVGAYRTAALRRRLAELTAAGTLRGCSVRELVRPLTLQPVTAERREAADVDTWADLAAIARSRPED